MLTLKNITKRYSLASGQLITAIDGIHIELNEGELLVLLGPSGSGKTTLLRIIAGLEEPSEGCILLDNRRIDSSGPVPDCCLIFQSYTAFPWLTVRENIAFGVKYKANVDTKDHNEIVNRLLNLIGLCGFEGAFPKELSGGMKQRVALARALASNPRILLMDEPFSALDVLTRAELQREFIKLRERNHFTSIFVTHDLDEALLLADRVIVLTPHPGRIQTEYNLRVELRNRGRHDPQFLRLRQEIYAGMSDAVDAAVSPH